MSDIVDIISKLSPLGDKVSFASYVKSAEIYYRDCSPYFTDKKMLWYLNFVKPNVYVMVLDAIRISRKYEKKKNQSTKAGDYSKNVVDVQSIIRLALEINKNDYNLDGNVQNLIGLLRAIPVGNADLTWKVKNEYARTINGLSKSFMSNLETCTSKQKSINEEYIKCKEQLRAVHVLLDGALSSHIVVKNRSVKDLLQTMCDYINVAVNVVPIKDFHVYKKRYETLFRNENAANIDILTVCSQFINRASKHVAKLSDIAKVPPFALLSAENVFDAYEALVDFVHDKIDKSLLASAGASIESPKFKSDKMINLKEVLSTVARYIDSSIEELVRLRSRQRDFEELESEIKNQHRTISTLHVKVNETQSQNKELVDSNYKKGLEIEKLAESLVLCESEIKRFYDETIDLKNKSSIAERELVEAKDAVNETRKNFDRLSETCDEMQKKLQMSQQDYDLLSRRNMELETRLRESSESETARMKILERANDVETGMYNEMKRLQEEASMYKMRSIESEAREIDREERHKREVEQLRQEFNNWHSEERRKINEDFEQWHKVQIDEIHKRYLEDIRSAHELCGRAIEEEKSNRQLQDSKLRQAIVAVFETIAVDTNTTYADSFEAYLSITKRIYDVVLSCINVDLPAVRLVADVTKNLNVRHAIDVGREIQKCDRRIETRHDLLDFIMHYWFLNRHFPDTALVRESAFDNYDDDDVNADKITVNRLRLEEFRYAVIEQQQHAGFVGDKKDDVESSPQTKSSFVDYFLRSCLKDYDVIEEESKDVIAKYIFDSYFIYVAEKQRLLKLVNVNSMRLYIAHKLPPT